MEEEKSTKREEIPPEVFEGEDVFNEDTEEEYPEGYVSRVDELKDEKQLSEVDIEKIRRQRAIAMDLAKLDDKISNGLLKNSASHMNIPTLHRKKEILRRMNIKLNSPEMDNFLEDETKTEFEFRDELASKLGADNVKILDNSRGRPVKSRMGVARRMKIENPIYATYDGNIENYYPDLTKDKYDIDFEMFPLVNSRRIFDRALRFDQFKRDKMLIVKLKTFIKLRYDKIYIWQDDGFIKIHDKNESKKTKEGGLPNL